MAAETIPDYQEWALEMPVQLLHERTDIVAGDVGRGHGEIQAQALLEGRDRDGAGHREAIMAVPAIVDGRLALRCPRAAHRGLQHEATLINKDDGAALTPGFF